MTAPRDLYEVLGVAKTSSQEEIKTAYKKLASKLHPDKNQDDPTATAKFQELSAAYDTLSDANKRQMYDIGGSDAAHGGGSGWGQSFHQHFHHQQGDNIVAAVTVTLEEAAVGAKKTVKYTRVEQCTTCNGDGAKPGSPIVACQLCRGTGQQTIQQGPYRMSMICPSCEGTGKKPEHACQTCRGEGAVNKSATIDVDLPPGIDNGQQMRVNHKGSYGSGGFGNLYINISIQPHATITRTGSHLYTTINVPFTTAILGGSVNVTPLIGPEVVMKIPPLTQPGITMRVAGKGIKTVQVSTEGDFMVKINIALPTTLTDEQKTVIEKFVELSQEG